MIAPERRQHATATGAKLSEPIAAIELDEAPNPAQVLADLYRRCGRGGGCPYTLAQIIRVLSALRFHGTVVATDIAHTAQMPASAVYGCVLEAEDYGLARWIDAPVHRADHITAEITAAGLRFLREIDTGGRH